MTLTLITINFNRASATIDLLRSLEAQTVKDFDVIVVDNDSTSDQRELLGAYASSSSLSLDVIYAEQNLGFSGGNNMGIRKALAQGSEWVLLINNDTTVGNDFIATLRATLPDHSAIVGLPIDEGERTVRAGRIEWVRPTLTHTTEAPHSPDAYAIGAGMAVHRDVFDSIGLLDEKYFLYFEDAEFSVRAIRAGIPIEFVSGPVIRHAVSGTTRALGSPLLLRYHFRNMIRFNRTRAPLWARAALPFWLAWQTTKQTVKIFVGRERLQSIAILAGIRDGLLNRGGNILRRPVIAVECESLEDVSWGVAQQLRGWLNAFVVMPEVRDHYDVVAYFKDRIPDEPWLNHAHVRAIVVRPFRWLPSSFSLYFFVFFPIRLWFDKPAVTFIANYMLPLLFRGKSIVMLTEDVYFEIHGRSLPFRYRLAYGIFATWAAHHATRIMAITRASAARVASLFKISPQRIAVNELAVSPARAVSPQAGSYILYVGQGLPRRHLRETIMAFALLAPNHPDVCLHVIGPDKYVPRVVADLIDSTNRTLGRTAVTWEVRVSPERLASEYAGARLLVYVSDMEAFGLPPLEALSYRVPSVLMNTPVHRELFGSSAFYTDSAEPAALAEVMERALTDESHRHSIAHEAESITSRYTWEQHAQRMYDIIRSIT